MRATNKTIKIKAGDGCCFVCRIFRYLLNTHVFIYEFVFEIFDRL